MRLIDADDLLTAFPIDDEPMLTTSCVRMTIRRMPTIEERKKGKWNAYYHGDAVFSYSCNQCGYSAPYGLYGGEYSQKKWRFCPNCGADMRGGYE